MANISKVTLPNGLTYDIKDDQARGLVVNVSLVSGNTCSCDTSVTDIIDAIEDGKNITCIYNGSDIFHLFAYDSGEMNVIFERIDTSNEHYIYGGRVSNADSWNKETRPLGTTTVVYRNWTYN